MTHHKVLFAVWNLELWQDSIQLDEVSFHRVEAYDQAIQRVQKGHEAVHTAVADVSWEGDSLPTPEEGLESASLRLRPYLLLLTLAQGVWVDWRARKALSEDGTIIAGDSRSAPFTRPHPSDLIWLPSQEQFLRQCHERVSSTFLNRTLFAVALSWAIQANEQDFEEADFLFRYTALEALGWAFVRETYAGDEERLATFESSPRGKIKHFLTQNRAPVRAFFPNGDEQLFELRDHIAHRGMAFERAQGVPFGREIIALNGLLDWCFLTLLGYRGPFRDIRHRGYHGTFPDDFR